MNLSDFTSAEENTVLAYAVYAGHTLGYLFKHNGQLKLGVLASKPLMGGADICGEPVNVTNNADQVRKATKEDFAFFRISSKGYDL